MILVITSPFSHTKAHYHFWKEGDVFVHVMSDKVSFFGKSARLLISLRYPLIYIQG